MSPKLSANDILNEIEFEIAQGTLYQEGLGEAVATVRQYQNKFRAEVFETLKTNAPYRDIFSRQFHVIDMLLNLLQETALQILQLKSSVKKLRQLPIDVFQGGIQKKAENAPQPSSIANETHSIRHSSDFPDECSFSDTSRYSRAAIEKIMQPEAIDVGLQAKPFHIPVFGWFLYKLRVFYQRPAQFYTRLLSSNQAQVNRILGDHILYLEEVIHTQQQQIQALSQSIADVSDEKASS